MLFTDFIGRVVMKPLSSANQLIKIIFYQSPFCLLISLYFEIRWRNKSQLPYQTLSLLQLSDWTAFVSAFLFPPFSPPTEQKSVCMQTIVLYFCTSIWMNLKNKIKKLLRVTFSERSEPFSSSWLSALETLPGNFKQAGPAETNCKRTSWQVPSM